MDRKKLSLIGLKSLALKMFPHLTQSRRFKNTLTVEGSTILLGSRTMLGECCLAAIQPKGFWTKLKAQERESVCVCVCEREGGRI